MLYLWAQQESPRATQEPIRVQNAEKKNKEAQEALLKLGIQKLKSLAKQQLLQNIARKQAREERIKKHDEFETKILMVPQENNRVFHALET